MKILSRNAVGRAAGLFALWAGLSCGGSGGASGSAHGCQSVQGSCLNNALDSSCADYAGFDNTGLAHLQSDCTQLGGSWRTSACDSSTSVGGCKAINGPTCSVGWSYPPTTAQQKQSWCSGALFVTP
jgi:hypothetical protein